MATKTEIQAALDSLGGSGAIDKDVIIKESLINKMKMSSNMSNDEIERYANDILKNKTGDLYNKMSSQISKLNVMIVVIPMIADSLANNLTSITAASSGTAAPAVPGMLETFKNMVKAAKAVTSDALSTALELGVDVPGIEPLLNAANTIANFEI